MCLDLSNKFKSVFLFSECVELPDVLSAAVTLHVLLHEFGELMTFTHRHCDRRIFRPTRRRFGRRQVVAYLPMMTLPGIDGVGGRHHHL